MIRIINYNNFYSSFYKVILINSNKAQRSKCSLINNFIDLNKIQLIQDQIRDFRNHKLNKEAIPTISINKDGFDNKYYVYKTRKWQINNDITPIIFQSKRIPDIIFKQEITNQINDI